MRTKQTFAYGFLAVILAFTLAFTACKDKDDDDDDGSGINAEIEMIQIPGGSFQMGNPDTSIEYSDDERPVRTVTLAGFSMSKTEVTQAQWKAVTGTTLKQQMASYGWDDEEIEEELEWCGVGDNYPMVYVSWYDAAEFCNKLSEKEGLTPYYTINKTTSDPNNENSYDDVKWLVTQNASANGYRLPTEAQWEYAAKGGNGSPGNYIYAGSNNADEVAVYWKDDYDEDDSKNWGAKPVGTKKANSLGLYDMSGNVYEWCWDWYGSYPSTAQTDPQGASSGSSRVDRGGGWVNSAQYARSAYRDDGNPGYRLNDLGFRLLRP